MACFLIKRKLTAWQNIDRLGRVKTALGVRIEGLDAVDIFIDQVDSQRQGMAHRKQVNEAATDRVLAWLDHLGYMLVTGLTKLGSELGRTKSVAAFKHKAAASNHRPRRNRHRSGTDRCND